ncbi:hypothetical protein [Azospirillum doebereinerae]
MALRRPRPTAIIDAAIHCGIADHATGSRRPRLDRLRSIVTLIVGPVTPQTALQGSSARRLRTGFLNSAIDNHLQGDS